MKHDYINTTPFVVELISNVDRWTPFATVEPYGHYDGQRCKSSRIITLNTNNVYYTGQGLHFAFEE